MDIKKIQELIKLLQKSEISELTVKEGENSISIKNKGTETYVAAPVATPAINPAVSNPQSQTQTPQTTAPAEPKNDKLITFRSPMVGTFYRRPGADKET